MTTGVRVNVLDSRKIRTFLDDLDPKVRGAVVDQALESIARLVEQRAKEVEIIRGRGRVSPPLRRKLSFRSGRLSGSISTDLSGRPNQFVVGSNVKYAPVHELGLAPYPKRPFLRPAADFVMETKAASVFRRALLRVGGRQ